LITLDTPENLKALRNLTPGERLEALTRLTEDNVVEFHHAADCWLSLGGNPEGVEMLYVAARARLAANRDYYTGGI
jgi:hypothetical protein